MVWPLAAEYWTVTVAELPPLATTKDVSAAPGVVKKRLYDRKVRLAVPKPSSSKTWLATVESVHVPLSVLSQNPLGALNLYVARNWPATGVLVSD
jgi:hypothetical protein